MVVATATATQVGTRTATVAARDEFQRAVDHLLVRTGTGDSAAFSALYDLTSQRVFGLCRRLVRDCAEAEDIAQEAFLEIWTKAASFDPARGAGTGWIMAISHHRTVDRIRSAEGARRRDAAWTREADRGGGGQPADRLLASADIDEVHAAIGQLSEVRREAVTYAFFTDHTYEQASRLLGIPLGTFKSRVRDGVLALRPLLGVGNRAARTRG
ncbi:MAG: sigma-70 family RNA polymerase sigma factor [Nakamurella sp.]